MRLFYIFLSVLFLTSCNRGKEEKILLTNITGELNDVLVVMKDMNWNSESGKSLNEVLTYPYAGLPQEEPSFHVIHIKPEGFTNVFQIYRNIIEVNIGEDIKKPNIWYGKDVFAKTQSFLRIEAPNSKQFRELINENAELIREFFRKAEIQRLQRSYKNHFSEDIMMHLKKNYGIKVDIPANYKLDKVADNFSWISFETPDMSQGIFVYSYPYTDTTQFNLDNLLTARDSVLKENVGGPLKGSYMQTEKRVPIKREAKMNKDGFYNVTLQGLWRVEGDFMGGPFISYAFLDKSNRQVICVDGYVYNPRKDKRNFIMQLEAILKTTRYDE